MTRHHWEHLLEGIHAEALDCFQANLAVLADAAHGPGTHLRLGSSVTFAPRFAEGALPTVDPGLDGRLAEAEALLGLRQAASGPLPAFVVADAFGLPWVPYFGKRHIEHSLLRLPDAVLDAYHIDTPLGRARPGVFTVGEPVAGTAEIHFEPVRPGRLRHLGIQPADPGTAGDYVAAYREHPDRVSALDRLTEETWLLARTRRLHAEWAPDARTAALAADWARVAESVYLAKRRVERGRAEPEWAAGLTGVLDAEAALAVDPQTAAQVRKTVGAVAARVLDTDDDLTGAGDGPALTALPTFSSFRMVDIVEQTEQQLGVELPPDTLVAQNLQDLDRLATVLARCRPGEGGTA